ncbi:MAG: PHP domain-containing protein [Candidatus Aenigmarchaeota archaeon]|nr:PHP domain-containing protein [Candidatus Aenigmarchaeota archaeon]
MLFELHSHSWYSRDKFGDHGFSSPIEMAKVAKRQGLNGIAITDHNSFKAWHSLKHFKAENFLALPGEEISTRQGHLLALGISEEIKPAQHFLETIDKIHAQGGIAVAPHPFDLGELGLAERAQHADAVEVFNAMNVDHFSNVRAGIFAKYHNMGRTAGSDAHTSAMVGKAITKINSGLDIDSVLKAIKSGKTKTFESYQSVMDMTDWYLDRLRANPKISAKHLTENHHPFKQSMLNMLMKHRGREGAVSKAIVFTLPRFSAMYSATKSLLVNGPECLM